MDGNETDIIKGAEKFLKNFCKSALIEIRLFEKETNEKCRTGLKKKSRERQL